MHPGQFLADLWVLEHEPLSLWIHGCILHATVSSQQEGRKWYIALILLVLLHNGCRVLWPKVAMDYFSKEHCLKMLQKILIFFPS